MADTVKPFVAPDTLEFEDADESEFVQSRSSLASQYAGYRETLLASESKGKKSRPLPSKEHAEALYDGLKALAESMGKTIKGSVHDDNRVSFKLVEKRTRRTATEEEKKAAAEKRRATLAQKKAEKDAAEKNGQQTAPAPAARAASQARKAVPAGRR